MDTENGDTDRIARFFRAMHIIVAGLYIYIYIELGYRDMQSISALVLCGLISKTVTPIANPI